jgi:hypothetical protein
MAWGKGQGARSSEYIIVCFALSSLVNRRIFMIPEN